MYYTWNDWISELFPLSIILKLYLYLLKLGSGIAQSVQQQATGWTPGAGVEGRKCSLLYSVQAGSEAYQMGTKGSFPKGKAAGAWI
jgi:hypothetical protein